ncbi:MAG TPA: tetratricopeptide repeat protein, partial [Polyangia bacterium]|nr:tetratricopeptide repeat protein [Polyangia bacterium]
MLLAAAVSFGICAAARAADESTPDKALNEAKEDFETAQTFFVRGEYDAAAAKFLEAYNKKPYPAFLFNVAVSYEKAKQLDKAKAYFERYLQDDPNASDAAQVRLRLDVIGKLLAPPPPPAPAPAAPAPGTPAAP